jgi:hypothetical protein
VTGAGGWRLGPRKILGALFVLGVLGGSAAGCGYSLAGHGSFLPADVKIIGIPAFTNHTPVFNLETQITAKVRSEFIGRGKYKILPQDTGVDAVLIGDVATVTVVPSSFAPGTQLASRYVITMTANIQLRDAKDDKVLWENPTLTFRQEYDSTSGGGVLNANAFFGQEANALDRVSNDFARAIVSAILEAF